MVEDNDGRANKLDLHKLTATIRSNTCWGLLLMLLAIHIVTDGLRALAESCPCHGWCHDGSTSSKTFKDMWKRSRFACPMAGRRGVELAHGVLFGLLDELVDTKLAELTRAILL